MFKPLAKLQTGCAPLDPELEDDEDDEDDDAELEGDDDAVLEWDDWPDDDT
jgi:hypothetical protein